MARRKYYDDYYRTAIKTTGGMKVKSKKGDIGTKWWSKRFIAILNSYGWETRLQRGKRYARVGQVLSVNIDSNVVSADVQGSRKKPYRISIEFPRLGDSAWEKIVKQIISTKGLVAGMLAGEVPSELENAFKQGGASLFPQSGDEINMNCTCPDYAIPCKHIAAVFYILADRLDDDPFLLFELNGKRKEELISAISKNNDGNIPENKENNKDTSVAVEELNNFWKPPDLHIPVENVRKNTLSPLKKYPLPMEFNDPEIQYMLELYYNRINENLKKIKEDLV
ncbi:SWIM zinc finger family protein [Ferroplasma acidarmanus]|jgi:uncharacterized Zn finger protein|uniref:SWIM-type domain-containing protein n=1 Tax=Ferroplasma acidarmanus Fer1 TaxID=333146 RepID=S0AMP0_FERAC|nr:SWIM zinc finger family protein [Ferroplasma acidarmanus]AGO60022.1 hypothetical protein FACI_IFERC00001G0042 [Ferroplasma acidarmanus Fer1]